MRQKAAPVVSRTVREQRAHLARELVETLLLVGFIFLIVRFTIQTYSVSNGTMGDALQTNQLVLVNTRAFIFGGPSRGDVIIVTTDPNDPNSTVARRVIGVPGDTITLTTTKVLVNGTPLDEPYIQTAGDGIQNTVIQPPVKLGPDQYYVLGDARVDSAGSDSRQFGPVARGNIAGKAVAVFWPLSQFHWIDTHSDTFSKVKNP